MWDPPQEFASVLIWSQQADIGPADCHSRASVVVRDVTVLDATYAGVQLRGPYAARGIVFENMTISQPGTYGVQVTADASGCANLSAVVVQHAQKQSIENAAGERFTLFVD